MDRIKRLSIDSGLFMGLFQNGMITEVVSGIPEDAQFRGFCHDYTSNTLSVFIEHESYPEVEPGNIPEDLMIQVAHLKRGDDGSVQN